MIQIAIHDSKGGQVGSLDLDESVLGGEVLPGLLKQAYVRFHANRRQGTAATKNRAAVEGSTRKLYKQKHTGNARRGAVRTNIMKGGGRGHSKKPHSWRLDMPIKMRRLANRNALLAKAVDGEIKLLDKIEFPKPSTKAFSELLAALKIDRTCLVALSDTRGFEGQSCRNLDHVSVTHVDRLNAFDLLNHRYLLLDKAALEGWMSRAKTQAASQKEDQP